VVTSPAKAEPVKARANANATVEMNVFMGFLPYACYLGAVDNAIPPPRFRGARAARHHIQLLQERRYRA
jgi:hypothetical protein